jgi:uncharacterized protein involved in exopolysaccharide biosynthesis
MEQNLNLLDVLKLIIKWKKHLFFIALASIAISSLVSLLMPNYYKSTAIFYASNPAMNDRQNLFREQASNLPLEYFGTESDVDRVLQICKSGAISGYIINKYNLGNHYKIEPNAKYYATKVLEEFKENSSMVRNELGAIEITIFDTDSKLAAEISNDIVATVDKINKEFFIVNNQKSIKLMQQQVLDKTRLVDKLTDTIAILRSSGKTDAINTLEETKKSTLKNLASVQQLFDQYTAAAENDFTTINTIEKAYPAEKKSKPIRWLIVVASLLSTLFISIMFLLGADKYNAIKNQIGE